MKNPWLKVLSGNRRPVKGHTQLKVGEIIKGGDVYLGRYDSKLHPSHDVGQKVGIPNRTSMQYYRVNA